MGSNHKGFGQCRIRSLLDRPLGECACVLKKWGLEGGVADKNGGGVSCITTATGAMTTIEGMNNINNECIFTLHKNLDFPLLQCVAFALIFPYFHIYTEPAD